MACAGRENEGPGFDGACAQRVRGRRARGKLAAIYADSDVEGGWDEAIRDGDGDISAGARRIERMRDEEDGETACRRSERQGRHALEVRGRDAGAEASER